MALALGEGDRRGVLAGLAPEWHDTGARLDRAGLGQALGAALGGWPLGPSGTAWRAELPRERRRLSLDPNRPDRARLSAHLEVERQTPGGDWRPWGSFEVEVHFEQRGRDWFAARSHTTPLGRGPR